MAKQTKPKVGRPPKVDWRAVVQAFRSEEVKTGAEAARKFGCSRVRISQILGEHAPDLLPGKAKPQTPAEARATRDRQAKMKKKTQEAIQANPTHTLAAQALGITPSGLYNRKRRLGLTA